MTEKIKLLKMQLRNKTALISRLNKKVFHMKLPTLENQIEETHISDAAKTLVKMQLLHKPKTPWTTDQKKLALDLWYRSPSAYKFLKEEKHIVLPSESSIRQWCNVLHLQPGLQKNLLEVLRRKGTEMTEKEKNCVILIDEIQIKKSLNYIDHFDYMEGYQDHGDFGREKKYATQALVLMIRGLEENYKLPVAYYLSAGPIKAKSLKEILLSCIKNIINCGFKVRAVISDQGTSNQSVSKKLGVTADNPFFYVENQKVFYIFDVVHIIKNIRSRLHDTDFDLNGKRICWIDIVSSWVADKKSSLSRCMGHLTEAHINPNNFQKMNVKLAVQIFSHRTAAGIKTAKATNTIHSDTAMDTAEFLAEINNMFDVMNSKFSRVRNPYKRVLSENNNLGKAVLEEALVLFKNLKVIPPTQTSKVRENPPCFNGMVQTITATLGLWAILKNEGFGCLRTSRINQDPLENCFSEIRRRGGFNRYPTATQLRHSLEDIIVYSISNNCKTGNCETSSIPILLEMKDFLNLHLENNNTEIEENCDEPETAPEMELELKYTNISIAASLEDCAVVYFSGYVAYKCIKKFKCETCQTTLCKNTFGQHETLIENRCYTNLTNLVNPSEELISVVRKQLKYFAENLENKKQQKNLKKMLITGAIKSDWFSTCSVHRKYMLDLLYRVKLYKVAKWESQALKNDSDKNKQRYKKIKQ